MNQQYLGRALALLAQLDKVTTGSPRRVLVPLAQMVLWEYAPIRTDRAKRLLVEGEPLQPAQVTRYAVRNTAGDLVYYMPSTEYHQYIAATQLGWEKAPAALTDMYTIEPTEFFIDRFGLWHIDQPNEIRLVASDIANELPILLQLGVLDRRQPGLSQGDWRLIRDCVVKERDRCDPQSAIYIELSELLSKI